MYLSTLSSQSELSSLGSDFGSSLKLAVQPTEGGSILAKHPSRHEGCYIWLPRYLGHAACRRPPETMRGPKQALVLPRLQPPSKERAEHKLPPGMRVFCGRHVLHASQQRDPRCGPDRGRDTSKSKSRLVGPLKCWRQPVLFSCKAAGSAHEPGARMLRLVADVFRAQTKVSDATGQTSVRRAWPYVQRHAPARAVFLQLHAAVTHFQPQHLHSIDIGQLQSLLRGGRQRIWDDLDICPRTAPSQGARKCTYARWFRKPFWAGTSPLTCPSLMQPCSVC